MLANNTLQLTLVIGLSLASVAASDSSPNRPPVPKAEVTVYAPNPEYPPEARQAHLAGSGWFRVDFTKTGYVTQVRVMKSTGSKILDAAAVQTLLHWRFKPGLKVHGANVPITFLPEPQKFSTIRVVWANGKTEEIPAADLNRYAVALPVPGYPPEAWPRGGAGLYELRIKKDGGVSGIVITKSIGEKILDLAAMRALIQYRFKPGVFKKVYVPIVYTVTRTR